MRHPSPIAALLLAACAAADPIVTSPPTPDTPTPTSSDPPPATPSDPPPSTPSAPPTTPILDIQTLTGPVVSREASQGTPAQFTARVAAVDTTTAGVWRLVLAADADTHEIKVQAPAALPPPLKIGDDVRATVTGSGGGPNYYLHLIFTAPDGQLLLAVGAAPTDWRVTRGEPGPRERLGDYSERSFGANFEHAGVRVRVDAGAWARMDVGGATYYVWASGAQRRLRPGKRPMPDYVGGWLDYAVVRVR